jgi:hypothetical protein
LHWGQSNTVLRNGLRKRDYGVFRAGAAPPTSSRRLTTLRVGLMTASTLSSPPIANRQLKAISATIGERGQAELIAKISMLT